MAMENIPGIGRVDVEALNKQIELLEYLRYKPALRQIFEDEGRDRYAVESSEMIEGVLGILRRLRSIARPEMDRPLNRTDNW